MPRLCEFYPDICLTTEEKARKNLSQGKKNLSQAKKNLSQVKKNLSQSAVYIISKHPHIFISTGDSIYATGWRTEKSPFEGRQRKETVLSYDVCLSKHWQLVSYSVSNGIIFFLTESHWVSFTKTSRLLAFRELIVVCPEDSTEHKHKHTLTLKWKVSECYSRT
jgi:hypothetical protein